MPTFEQKAKSAVQKANVVDGEYCTILIEKHEKDADLRKMVGIYKKAVNAEVVSTSDEGVVVKYRREDADRKLKAWQDQGNNAVRRDIQKITPDAQHAEIVEMGKNTVEEVSAQELIGSN